MPNLEYLSTGASTVYLPFVWNGIHKYVYPRESSYDIIESIWDQARFVTRILIPLFGSRSLWSGILARFFRKRELSIFSQLRSTTMAFSGCMPLLSRLIIAYEMGPETRCLGSWGRKQKTWPALCTSSHRAEHQFFFHMARNSLVTFHKKSQDTAFIGQPSQSPSLIWLPSLIQAKNSEDWACEPVNWCGLPARAPLFWLVDPAWEFPSLLWCAFWLIITI